MESLAKSDIFFFITTIAIVVVATMMIIAGFFIIKILKDLKDVSTKVKEESGKIIEDVAFVRKGFEKGGSKIVDKIKSKIVGNDE